MTEERQIPLHRSLIQPALWWGGERELVAVLWGTMLALFLLTTELSLVGLAVSMAVGVVGQYGLMKAAQSDPIWGKVYWRSLQYRSWYPARSHSKAKPRKRPPSVP